MKIHPDQRDTRFVGRLCNSEIYKKANNKNQGINSFHFESLFSFCITIAAANPYRIFKSIAKL